MFFACGSPLFLLTAALVFGSADKKQRKKEEKARIAAINKANALQKRQEQLLIWEKERDIRVCEEEACTIPYTTLQRYSVNLYGRFIRIAGTVSSVYNETYYIRDQFGNTIIVDGFLTNPRIIEGDIITCYGKVDINTYRTIPKISALKIKIGNDNNDVLSLDDKINKEHRIKFLTKEINTLSEKTKLPDRNGPTLYWVISHFLYLTLLLVPTSTLTESGSEVDSWLFLFLFGLFTMPIIISDLAVITTYRNKYSKKLPVMNTRKIFKGYTRLKMNYSF